MGISDKPIVGKIEAENAALKALVRDLAEYVDTPILDSIEDEHPLLKKIMEGKNG